MADWARLVVFEEFQTIETQCQKNRKDSLVY
jgi:hypothetical protein